MTSRNSNISSSVIADIPRLSLHSGVVFPPILSATPTDSRHGGSTGTIENIAEDQCHAT